MDNNEKEQQEQVEIGIPSIGIPSEIAFNPHLIASEKQLFGIIRNLAKTDKGCTASNRYLANCIDSGPQTASNHINKLKKYLYIIVKFKTKENVPTKEQERIIYINPEYMKIYEPVRGLMHQVYIKNYSPLKNKLKEAITKIIKEYYSNYKKIDIEEDIERDSIVDKSTIIANPADSPPSSFDSAPDREGHPTVLPYLELWNSLPNVNHHARPGTKVRHEAAALLLSLRAGTFYAHNSLDKEWLKHHHIDPKRVRNHRFTDNEIRKGLKLISRLYTSGYGYPSNGGGGGWWPSEADRQKLPRSLPTALFNPKSGKSMFLRCLFDPPRLLKDIVPEDPDPETTKRFTALLPRTISSKETQILVQGIREMKEFHAAMDWQTIKQTNGYRYYVGYPDDPEMFFTYYLRWLQHLQEEDRWRGCYIGPRAFHWPEFCQLIYEEEGFDIRENNAFFKKLAA